MPSWSRTNAQIGSKVCPTKTRTAQDTNSFANVKGLITRTASRGFRKSVPRGTLRRGDRQCQRENGWLVAHGAKLSSKIDQGPLDGEEHQVEFADQGKFQLELDTMQAEERQFFLKGDG